MVVASHGTPARASSAVLPNPRRVPMLSLRAPRLALLAALAAFAIAGCDQPTEPLVRRAPPPRLAVGGAGPIDLGTLGGFVSEAYDINEAGQVVGYSTDASGATRAFLWTQAGGMIDLGDLGGGEAIAYSINESGQVAGESLTDAGDWHAFLWTAAGGMADLGTLPGGLESAAYTINDAGVVAGDAENAAGEWAFFTWSSSGGMVDRSAGTAFSAWMINSAGHVSGCCSDPLAPTASLYDGASFVELGTLAGGTVSVGQAVNDADQVVGWSDSDAGIFAFLWQQPPGGTASMVSLGDLGGGFSEALDINDATPVQVTGFSYTSTDGPFAFVWTAAGGMQSLGTLTGGTYSYGYAINDAGQVVGSSEDASGEQHATMFVVTGGAANHAPVVNAGPDQSRPFGRSTFIPVDFTDADAGDGPWSYTIDFGDGRTISQTAASPGPQTPWLHNYAPGTYTVTVAVVDGRGAVGTDQVIVTMVPNATPVAVINGPYTGSEGKTVCFTTTGTADPNLESLTLWVETGYGTATVWGANPCYTYPDDGTFTVTLHARDPSGAEGTATTTATIANVAPTATWSAPSQITEGLAHVLSLSNAFDAGPADRPTLQYAFDCGNGAGQTAWSASVTSVTCPAYPNQLASPAPLRGLVRDDEGVVTTYTRSLTVVNALPVVSLVATSPTTFQAGGTFAVQGSFTDRGVNDGPWTYELIWGTSIPSTTGTASAPGALPPFSRVYATPGVYRVGLQVKDQDDKPVLSTQITITVTP